MYVNISVKRACVNWGVGRELYTAPKIFVNLNSGEYLEQGDKVKLSPKCVFTVAEIGYDEARNINALTIVDQNGVIRYKMGQTVQQPQGDTANYSESNADFKEQLNAYILPALEQAKTEDEVKSIWDEYADYQKLPEFVAVITARLNKIKNAA